MKRLTQILPVFLAAALQIMPLVRNLFLNPAAGNTIAFILRWGIGTGAALGAVDAVSGASLPVIFNSPTNYTGTKGIYFTNNVSITNNAKDPGAFFVLSNSLGTTTALFTGNTTTNCMPPGLTFKCVDLNDGNNQTPLPIYGAMYGTNLTGVTNFFIKVSVGHPSYSGYVSTNIYISILPAVSGTAPTITNQPVSLTNNVGSNVLFSVTAGTAPLNYQWYFNTNTALLNATNTSLSLTNLQLTNTGNYRVIITNSSGAATSTFAALTVWLPPVITNQPVGVTNIAGSSPSFSVTAGGVPAVAYQWQLNTNTSLAGFTGTSLTLTNVRASQSNTFYSVVISNSAGSITSSFARLMITNPLPAAFTPGAPALGSGKFQFSFTPVIGLTNTVLTNGVLNGGTWNVFTNIPPPATATPLVISNAPSAANLFFRVMVQP